MEYHLGGVIAIGSGGLEFDSRDKQLEDNPQVEIYADHLDRLSGSNESEMEFLDEAGNISSGLAIRIHNSIIRYGKEVIKAKTVEDKLDMIARQNVTIGGMVLMSVAVSGDKSFGSLIAKAFSNKRI